MVLPSLLALLHASAFSGSDKSGLRDTPEGHQGGGGDATHGTPGGSDAEFQEVQDAIAEALR
jgi:hypothetical protein